MWGRAPPAHIPLMAPPPRHDTTVRAAQRPSSGLGAPGLVARCDGCLRDRWCNRCQDWWCEACYVPGAQQRPGEGPRSDQGTHGNLR